jgi:subtilase family protein
MSAKNIVPKSFFLNEQHELSRAEKEGGGAIPKYIDVDWNAKGAVISQSLGRVRDQLKNSRDPSKEHHYFVLAAPVPRLAKASTNKKKAVEGKVYEQTDFAEKHSRVFRRLGLDLLSVAEDGSAIVHMKPASVDRLSNTARSLRELSGREKSRWATIERFDTVPSHLRIDSGWLEFLKAKKVTDAVVELQPFLNRSEIDSVIHAIVSMLSLEPKERLSGTGSDFSGRQWVRGQITPESLKSIAETFFSVQSLHSPLISVAAASSRGNRQRLVVSTSEVDPSHLPVVGVLDTGVPAQHSILTRYRRGTYTSPTVTGNLADSHGSYVSSRVVFGDVDISGGVPDKMPPAEARFYDINISGSQLHEIDEKAIYPALQAVVSTAPDVRVFNMSFDSKEPLNSMLPVKRSETLSLIQDLDNFIFQNDIVVVVSAGNSPFGLVPSIPYPNHLAAPEWSLGAWARSFNSLTCGSFVGRLSSGGLVTQAGWPSPFCRVGPGLCQSPKPDFSANGGNGTAQYQYAPGLGVSVLSATGHWEDHCGTSYAVPLLARECAFALDSLQGFCEQGAQPFSVTVKAFLALTAVPPIDDPPVQELARLTLGRGLASAKRLAAPSRSTGVMIWQGVLEDDKDIARIQIPVPSEWVRDSSEPYLRLIVSWDPPVNSAVREIWSTRNVIAKLRPQVDAPAARTARVVSHGTYPLLERTYDLRKFAQGIETEAWIVEIAYEQIAEYNSAMSFPTLQRVAFAAELFDNGEPKISPQAALQALPATATMTRLTIPPTITRMPVLLRNPL